MDGRVTQHGWLGSGLGSARRLHALMVLAGHTQTKPPPSLLAADYTPTCWMGGEGWRGMMGEGKPQLPQHLLHTRTHTHTHTHTHIIIIVKYWQGLKVQITKVSSEWSREVL